LAQGDLDVLRGAWSGFELGTGLQWLSLAPLLAGGVPPLVVSRLMAALVGASAAGVLAGAATRLTAGPASRARSAGLLTALLVAFCWPTLHRETTSLWGSTPEATPLALACTFLLMDGRGPGSAALGGAFGAAAWSFSPVGLPALGIGLLLRAIALVEDPRKLVQALLAALGGMVLFFVAVAGLPGGPRVLREFGVASLGIPGRVGAGESGADGGILRRLTTLGGVFGGASGSWIRPVLPLGVLASGLCSLASAPRRALLLLWPMLVLLQGRAPGAERYSFVFAGCLLVLAVVWAVERAPRPGLVVLVAVTACGAAASQIEHLPPPSHPGSLPFVVFGDHRGMHLWTGEDGPRTRDTTLLSLLPAVPVAHRAEVAFGAGHRYAHAAELPLEGLMAAQWTLTRLERELPAPARCAFSMGLGCGLATSGRELKSFAAVLAPLEGSALDRIHDGVALCSPVLGVPATRAPADLLLRSCGLPVDPQSAFGLAPRPTR
jgi:hypothetical protein